MTDSPATAQFVQSLLELGFSQYEARCYVGLLVPEAQTGYGVAKLTGVPQPKVYEALRKLVSRGAARELTGEPVRFVAVPPEELLADLKDSCARKLARPRATSRQVPGAGRSTGLEHVERLTLLPQVLAAAVRSIASAQRRVYLSASSTELKSLRDCLEDAVGRDVDAVILAFGRAPFAIEGLRVFHHASTDGAVYRHHQSRHVALVADSRETVYGVAPDGKTWHGIATSSMPIIAAVKGFIRHDIDMQQVYADFGPQLIDLYGPGLQGLEGYRRQDPVQDRQSETVGNVASRRRKTG